MLLSNARNVVRVEDGVVVKRSADLAGELFFYRELALRVPRLRRLFPRLLPGSSTARLELELVPATPLTRVFAGLRMRPRHLSAVFVALGELHAVGEAEVALTTSPAAAKRFLAEKTAARFAAPEFAGLRDAPRVLQLLLARLEAYEPTCVRVVHGDAWFANILLEEGSNGDDNNADAIGAAAPPSLQPEAAAPCVLRFVDMRGCIGGKLTLNGDPLYDFAKLLQSLLGFDEAVFDLPTVPPDYRSGLLASFFSLVRARGARPGDVLTITLCLMAGSIPFHARRERLWHLVCALVESACDGTT
jgi:hypothetical protein